MRLRKRKVFTFFIFEMREKMMFLYTKVDQMIKCQLILSSQKENSPLIPCNNSVQILFCFCKTKKNEGTMSFCCCNNFVNFFFFFLLKLR